MKILYLSSLCQTLSKAFSTSIKAATIREPTCHFSGKVKHENFIPESIVPNIVESFFDVNKGSHYTFPPGEN